LLILIKKIFKLLIKKADRGLLGVVENIWGFVGGISTEI
jgi:hypothetical protein